MKIIKSIVKKYSREYSRTLKNGKKKKYHTEQVQITIPKEDNIFEDEDTVLIIKSKHEDYLKNVSEKVNSLELEKTELKEANIKLKSTIEKNNSTIYNYKEDIGKLKDKIAVLEINLENKALEENKNHTIIKNNEQEETAEENKYSYQYSNEIDDKHINGNMNNYIDNIYDDNIYDKIDTEEANINPTNFESNFNKEKINTSEQNIIFKLKLEQRALRKDKKDLKEKIRLLESHINDLKYNMETIDASKNRELLRLQDDYDELSYKYKNKKLAIKKLEKSANYYKEVSKKLKEFILKYY